MDASPLLARLLTALAAHKFEAVLIGNAAAAIQGAPVTTLDFDFMFRETATNLRKLKAVASDLQAVILRPFYPVSKLYRMVDDANGLQADFMPVIHGVRSFEGLRARASEHTIGGVPLKVAALADIIASKKAAGRDRDLAILPVLERTLRATQSPPRRKPRP
jgi:predicted nucleotidyltransferase